MQNSSIIRKQSSVQKNTQQTTQIIAPESGKDEKSFADAMQKADHTNSIKNKKIEHSAALSHSEKVEHEKKKETHRSDLNGDGTIDLADLNLLLKYFNENKHSNVGDIDGDGQRNFFDIVAFLNDFASQQGL